MDMAHFAYLCNTCECAQVSETDEISIEEQIVVFLHTIGHNQRKRLIQVNWKRSGEIISRHFHNVLQAIFPIYLEFITGPTTGVHRKVAGSHRFYPYFKVKILFCNIGQLKNNDMLVFFQIMKCFP